MSKIKLDLNTRERARYAKQLTDLAEHASKAATDLTDGADHDFIAGFLFTALSQTALKEISEYLMTAMKDRKTAPFTDFSETIESL